MTTDKQERILCAAIYVDTGEAQPPRMSYSYPETGLVFAAWRHGDCFTTFTAWKMGLTDEQRSAIAQIGLRGMAARRLLHGSRQGFLTSKGRFVDRVEAQQIAKAAGQVDEAQLRGADLFSEDLY